jgi:release factor glutamine methyltransferase
LPSVLRGRVDTLVANVPYVPTEAISMMPPEARDYEPRYTLDGGPDGLAIFRRVVSEAPEWLSPGGSLFVELSSEQAPIAIGVMNQAGLIPHVAREEDGAGMIIVGMVL